MSDSFTEVTHESWFGRLGNSIKGVLFGIILFIVAFPLLWWNEGRSVHTAKALKELDANVVSVSADKVQSQYEGKPVHMTAEAVSDETMTDPDFGVSAPGIKLRRKVEMYQWKETEKTKEVKKTGGGSRKETTYSYDKEWSEEAIDSNSFNSKYRQGHENPGSMRFTTLTKTAAKVSFGRFTLSDALLDQMTNFEPLSLGDDEVIRLEGKIGNQMAIQADTVYLPHKAESPIPAPANPQIGDLRVSFLVIKPTTVSIIAKQTGSTFRKWQSSQAKGMGTSVERLVLGSQTAEEIVGQMQSENAMLTWGLRLAGFLLMAFGIGMVFSPLAVLADVLPFLGDLLRMGIGLFAAAVAASLSLVTIALAWLAYRPLFGAALLAVAAALVVALKMLGSKKRAAAEL